MSEGGGVIRRLVAILGLDFKQTDFDNAEHAIQNVKQQFAGLVGLVAGGLIAHGFKNMVLGAVEAADAVEKTSVKLGISTDALQELQHAANLSGVDAGSLAGSLGFLARNSAEAARGTLQAQEGFTALGIGVTDAHGKVLPTEDLLMRVAGAMEGVKEPAERVRIAMKLFGRDGMSIIPMLDKGAAGLQAMRQDARDLGGGFDPEFIAQAVEIDDNIKRLEYSFSGLKNMIVAEVLPAVSWLVKAMIAGWRSIREWLKGTNVVKTVLIALTAASAAAAFILTSKLLVALAGVARASVTAALGFGQAGAAAFLMQLKAMLMGAAFLALIGLLVLIGDEILTALHGGDTLLGRLEKKLSDLYAQFMDMDLSDWPLLKPIRELLQMLDKVKEYFYALVMAARGDFSGLNMLRDEGKNSAGAKTADLSKDSTQQGQGDFRKLDKKDFGFLKSVVRAAVGAGDAYAMIQDAPLVPLVGGMGAPMVNAPVQNVTMTVIAAPGQDEKAVGDAAAKSTRQAWQSMIDDAQVALLPLAGNR